MYAPVYRGGKARSAPPSTGLTGERILRPARRGSRHGPHRARDARGKRATGARCAEAPDVRTAARRVCLTPGHGAQCTCSYRERAKALSSLPSDTGAGSDRKRSEEEYRVLSSFFKGDRLRTMPAREKKRVIVLQFIAEAFQLGRSYTEPEVNAVLRRFYDDHCRVRRELVDRGFLGRDGGIYWRGR